MCSAFRDFTTEKAVFYDRFLRDIPPPLLTKAINSLILTARYPPTIAEIREEAEKIWSAAKGESPPDPGKAWGEVVKAIRRYGYYRTPEFEDPICAEVVNRLGWQEICETPVDDTVGLRAHFIKLYSAALTSERETRRANQMLADGEVQQLVEQVAMRIGDGNENTENQRLAEGRRDRETDVLLPQVHPASYGFIRRVSDSESSDTGYVRCGPFEVRVPIEQVHDDS